MEKSLILIQKHNYDGEEVYYEFSYDELLQDYRDGDLLVYRMFR